MHDRFKAELLKSALEAYGIPVEMFQEGVGHYAIPTTINGLAETQIFVPKHHLKAAQNLLQKFSKTDDVH